LHFLLVTKQIRVCRLDQTIGKPYYHGNSKDRQRSTLCARIAHIEQQVGLHYTKLLNIGNTGKTLNYFLMEEFNIQTLYYIVEN